VSESEPARRMNHPSALSFPTRIAALEEGLSTMTRRKKIYEGKAKILYEGPEPGTLIQYFKDDTTAFDATKRAVLEGKGVINNRISEYVMTKLNTIGVQNHFIKRLNLREQLIKEVEIIPLEVVCRNIAAGSLSTRLGLPEGEPLPRSIIEFYFKNDKLHDPMVAEEHITAFNWATTQEIDDIMALTLRVNDYLSGLFAAVGITLVDFKVEYGRVWEGDFARIILADEISPDSCRLWDTATNEKLDKDRFRRDLRNVIESYTEVARRLGIMKEMPTVIQGGIH
jgi:phosphoribosylaminoimidazole-succinocarboxamide synthase